MLVRNFCVSFFILFQFTEALQAHLNLREQYFPYKHIIASVILDKNPTIRTVINKISDVGTESVFRTFQYELLAGDPDLNVEVKDEQCIFRFDYSKVYWNSRLNTEHRRLIELFETGDAVCDVMAGVGPFAVPAGKKKVFAWANDLNPESYASLEGNIKRNKVLGKVDLLHLHISVPTPFPAVSRLRSFVFLIVLLST